MNVTKILQEEAHNFIIMWTYNLLDIPVTCK